MCSRIYNFFREKMFQESKKRRLALPPFYPPPCSSSFPGLFCLLEQSPDSVPCTCKRIITAASLGETGLLSAGRSLMWMQMGLSAHMHKYPLLSWITSGRGRFWDLNFSGTYFHFRSGKTLNVCIFEYITQIVLCMYIWRLAYAHIRICVCICVRICVRIWIHTGRDIYTCTVSSFFPVMFLSKGRETSF